jgi:hypothetical protein
MLLMPISPGSAGDFGCANFFAFPMILQSSPLPLQGVYEGSNTFATLEPNEPRQGGKMNNTCWARIKPTKNARIILNTFGSAFDTVLAVYTGTKFSNLQTVAVNDNFAAAGIGNKTSLVAFDAQADTDYHIQIGSRTGATGDFYLNVSAQRVKGELTAQLVSLHFPGFDQPWFNADYDCVITNPSGSCPTAVFVLYNGTDKTLNVDSSSDLGDGVRKPDKVTIAPGQTSSVRFRFAGNFDKTTTRSIAGQFTFEGRLAGKVISTATHSALVVVNGSAAQPDVLEVEVSPTIRAGVLNEPLKFEIKLKNTGAETAIGCHVRRADALEHLRVGWSDPGQGSGQSRSLSREVISIAAGERVKRDVTILATEERIGDPEFPLALHFDCANTASAPMDLSNGLDYTAMSMYQPARMVLDKLAPDRDTLPVPDGGSATFRVSAVNRSPAADLRVIPLYLRPFEDAAETQFGVTVCRTATENGACLAPDSSTVEYTAATNETAFFKVTVSSPSENPGFDPGRRRVVLKFWQIVPEGGVFDAVVGAESVAVKLK